MLPFLSPMPTASSASASSISGAPSKLAIVIGSGVIGLTHGILLQKSGYQVKIVSSVFPDSNSLSNSWYCSDKAGAHWFSFAADTDLLQQRIDKVSYHFLYTLSILEPKRSGVRRITSNGFSRQNTPEISLPWFKSFVHGFSVYSPQQIRELNEKNSTAFVSGYHFDSLILDPVVYLQFLFSLFQENGGQWEVKKVESLAAAIDEYSPQVLVNATGLGARTLGGVNDEMVYSVRGQSVIVRAPLVKEIIRTTNGPTTYCLPRGDGIVVLGSTFQAHHENTEVDPLVTADIIQRCSELHPLLRPTEKNPSPYEIISETVGLRPYRNGGARVEVERANGSDGKKSAVVLHNYAHGGWGIQSSWGSALYGLELVDAALEGKTTLKNGAKPTPKL